jgi:hypothetical protein
LESRINFDWSNIKYYFFGQSISTRQLQVKIIEILYKARAAINAFSKGIAEQLNSTHATIIYT